METEEAGLEIVEVAEEEPSEGTDMEVLVEEDFSASEDPEASELSLEISILEEVSGFEEIALVKSLEEDIAESSDSVLVGRKGEANVIKISTHTICPTRYCLPCFQKRANGPKGKTITAAIRQKMEAGLWIKEIAPIRKKTKTTQPQGKFFF